MMGCGFPFIQKATVASWSNWNTNRLKWAASWWGGTPYETADRETYSFIVRNGVSDGTTITLIDPMATVYHDNSNPHILPLELHLPTSATNEIPTDGTTSQFIRLEINPQF